MANELNNISLITVLLKIKRIAMQITRLVQAVILMLIVAMAASCAAGKEYTRKVFASKDTINETDSSKLAMRFLELESLEAKDEGWVTTDIIMGRDTGSKTIALDNLAKIFPAKKDTSDAIVKIASNDSTSVVQNKTVETKSVDSNINKSIVIGETRNKRTRSDK
ncbi:MAG TPA: hypothetical protein PK275_13235 [Chitinophagaceae bacterium]|nr:hypothetical protein [Chitinophagaceae bacterium]